MKFFGLLVSALLTGSVALATAKTGTNTLPITNTQTAVAPNTLAFNFVGLSQGKANLYFDIGGLSERVTPSLSFRTYSNAEKRQHLQNRMLTVDRSIATVGASFVAVKVENKSLILNPYLYFGTERDLATTNNKYGMGARMVAQAYLNDVIALQGGVDANNMEETFKSDFYIGMSFAL